MTQPGNSSDFDAAIAAAADDLLRTYPEGPRRSQAEHWIQQARTHRARFQYMLGLTKGRSGRFLDIGFNPVLTYVYLESGPTEVELVGQFDVPPGSAPVSDRWCIRGRDLRVSYFNIERNLPPYEDATFDVVLFLEVFEHLSTDPMHALAEINRVTKDGGTLLFSTPNIASVRAMHLLAEGRNPYISAKFLRGRSTDRHNREYTALELVEVMQCAGFEVESVETPSFYSGMVTPKSEAAIRKFIRQQGGSDELRGDTAVLRCRKVSSVIDRYPDVIYFPGQLSERERADALRLEASYAAPLRHYARAERALRELVKLVPNDKRARLDLADMRMKMDRHAEAAADIVSALQSAAPNEIPSDTLAVAFHALESCWSRQGDTGLASNEFAALGGKFAAVPAYQVLAGIVAYHSDDRVGAITALRRARQLDPLEQRAATLLRDWFPGEA